MAFGNLKADLVWQHTVVVVDCVILGWVYGYYAVIHNRRFFIYLAMAFTLYFGFCYIQTISSRFEFAKTVQNFDKLASTFHPNGTQVTVSHMNLEAGRCGYIHNYLTGWVIVTMIVVGILTRKTPREVKSVALSG